MTNPMTEIGKSAGNELWPSLEAASRIFDVFSFVLIGSLAAGVLATALIVWMGIVKEHHWDLLREGANEKIASLGLETATANEAAGRAHERAASLELEAAEARRAIADANARAVEAHLELEKFKAPRTLSPEQQAGIASILRGFSGQEYAVSMATGREPFVLLGQLDDLLASAGWIRREPFGDVTTEFRGGRAGFNSLSGISVRGATSRESELRDVLVTFASALRTAGLDAEATHGPELNSRPGVIHVMVGTKH